MHLQLFWFLLLTAAAYPATAHDWLTSPRAYNRVYRARDCKGRQCRDACPPRWAHGMNNSVENPAAVWRRGQKVRITYARNNHHGGMMRIAIVPVNKMWDRPWHEKMTIMHGCWEAGLYKCSSKKEDCGTDKDGNAFERYITVPSVFQDGDYVLGFVWYGGLYFDSRHGFFPDFYSCSHVMISGGKPVGGVHQPYFEPGKGRSIKRRKCRTSTDKIGQCQKTGCPKRESFRSIPRVFKKGRFPDLITPRTVSRAFNAAKSRERSEGTALSSANHHYPITHPSKSQSHLEQEKSGEIEQFDRGICKGQVCCASSCEQCGGNGCELREGGGLSCCIGRILESKRICGQELGAPCIRT